MRTEGVFSPETEAGAREAFESVGPAAQVVVRETAKAMEFDREEYDERITGEVVETAREALFASLLTVHVGSVEEWEAWQDDHPSYDVHRNGSEHVDNVVWHVVPFAETAVAATYQQKEEAAIGTLRRQAFGRIYDDLLKGA
ncbi:MAG: DUF5809 family protein [Halolamina sp.]|jgi:hypothetical protein|uniref:DUF5809 family protein n=1 Tax=Halolamina sp. TaxID=1940283 RepID=UPI002FC2F2E1